MSARRGTDPQIAERRRGRRAAERRRRAAVRRRNALAGFALVAFALGLLTGAGGVAKRSAPRGAGTRQSTAAAPLIDSSEDVPLVEDFHGPVPILMYHGIGAAPPWAAFPDLFVPEPELRAQIDWLAARGYHAVTLDQLFAAWDDGRPIPRKPIVISFDDGLRSQYVGAFPVLRAHGWPGVLNLKLASLEQGELTDEMVDEMIAAGWEVDSHTITHADVAALDGAELRREVAGSRRMLANRFDVPVDFFCYPGGDYDAEAIRAVSDAGYLGATTTRPGLASPRSPFELARIRVGPAPAPTASRRRWPRTASVPADGQAVGAGGDGGSGTVSDLERAVSAVVGDCLGVREGEEVLVVCNPATIGLGTRLRGEAGKRGADAVMALMTERASHAAEPPASIAAAMAAADVVLAPTVQSLSHTAGRRAATDAGVRIATLPGVTEEMLARVMSADMEGLRRKGAAVAERLTAGAEARITSAAGSDLRLGLAGREAIADAGDMTARGAFGNLPCGEGFIAPVEGTSEGILVVDGTIATLGVPDEPVELTVERGHLTAASGAVGEQLMELLSVGGEGGTNVAELGIGTNERAILSGEVLEDEKLLGTCHVAFGASAAIGGTVQVPVHLDCVVMRPEVTVDGEPIVRDGDLLV